MEHSAFSDSVAKRLDAELGHMSELPLLATFTIKKGASDEMVSVVVTIKPPKE